MKKFFTILMAFAVLSFTQCKKQPVDNPDTETEVRKVRVSCVIPINKGVRSDFSNLIENGSVNWSDGRECVYLAIPGDTPRIVELEGWADGNPSKLEFEGEVAEGLITSGNEYDIWYFGHSQQLETPYYSNNGSRLEGSIATQSGRLNDVGYNHIAKTTVTAVTEEGAVKLNLNGTLTNQIAIALLDLNNVSELYGNAIKGTEYKLQYNADTEKYELAVTEDNDAKISVESATGISYVVLLPNEEKETMIKNKQGDMTYAYTFHNGIKNNKIYYRTASDGNTMETLTWSEYEEETNAINGHEYVDLGLPSGLKWATCNVGATKPEEYGNYYAWGEITTKEDYQSSNCATYQKELGDISGNPEYDVAVAQWGGGWRMPKLEDMYELVTMCEWIWATVDTVSGFNVMSKENGNHIFLPASGFKYGIEAAMDQGVFGYYWTSTPYSEEIEGGTNTNKRACYVEFSKSGYMTDGALRRNGFTIRPVSE